LGYIAKRALITGVTGQDGSYLTEFLLVKGYEVHGVMRRASLFNTDRIDHLYHDPHLAGAKLTLHYGDLTDGTGLRRCSKQLIRTRSITSLPRATSRFRSTSRNTAEVVAVGTLRLIEALRDYVKHGGRPVRYYQAGSSEMFGAAPPPQSERTPFYPRSPYGVSKVAAHWFAINYREAYGLFICNGILFNHESPRRGETFVTRKVTRAVGRITEGLQDKLYLGNLEAQRDWGFTGDYVEAMWLMLQQEKPDDYIIATGEAHSVGEFVELAFSAAGLDWRRHVEVNRRYFRPTEVDALRGDPAKARGVLGWEPRVTLAELVTMMVRHDIDLARRERTVTRAGFADPARGAAIARSD
jgi:GDPmannose 4,6-dehydratase